MTGGPFQKLVFIGCPLDCDERENAVREKRALLGHPPETADPYEMILSRVREEIAPGRFEERGTLRVPPWLLPLPPADEESRVSVQEAVRFLDGGGCRAYAEEVGAAVGAVFPDVPCLIGVDHSVTGGAWKKIAELCAPEEVSLLVLDSHTDALTVPVLAGAIHYDMQTNSHSRYDPQDPFLKDRPDSYNASSFLQHLLQEGALKPQNLYILGAGDYPPKKAFRIKDKRIRAYTGTFEALRRKGVHLVTKADVLTAPSKLNAILKDIRTPYLYVSIDLDIGARNALEAVRFQDRQGLSEQQIYSLAEKIRGVLRRGVKLAGMDLLELSPRRLLAGEAAKGDRTAVIASNLIRILVPEAFEAAPSSAQSL